MAVNWYLYSAYFHILVWNKTAFKKDETTNDNSRYVRVIFLMRAELLSFVFTMVPGKDVWRDLANLATGVTHTCFIYGLDEKLFASGSIINDKHRPTEERNF